MSGTSSTGDISKVSFLNKYNNPPYTPSDPYPIGDDISICPPNLSWTGGDPDGDNVTYDVYFSHHPGYWEKVAYNLSETWYQIPFLLDFLTTYYWMVVAKDEHGASTPGPIWYFSTEENFPPCAPSQPYPEDGAPDVPIENVTLCWVGCDPNECDMLRYDLYFDDVNPPLTQRLSESYENCLEIPFTLSKYKTYYWQVNTWDSGNLFTEGPIWSFSTGDNCTPSEPIINGPIHCKVGVEYTCTFNSTYESGYDLIYDVIWGDGSPIERVGPSPPGVEIEATHTWKNKGTFYIRVRATDSNGVCGPWGELQVTVTRNKLLHNFLFINFLNRYPFIQDLLDVLGRYIKWGEEVF